MTATLPKTLILSMPNEYHILGHGAYEDLMRLLAHKAHNATAEGFVAKVEQGVPEGCFVVDFKDSTHYCFSYVLCDGVAEACELGTINPQIVPPQEQL